VKLLSKSRFKIGLECPNKLYYTYHKDRYPSTKEEDSFLQSLAQGGFQVEELARMHYPGGHLVDTPHWDYGQAVEATSKLLEQENVIIYEAAFMWDGLFIRTDILKKKGDRIDLVEVKAKSFDGEDDYFFIGKLGRIVSGWKPYLFDLAFQTYVLEKARPDFHVTAYLMLADKNKRASVDGLNQMFRIPTAKDGDSGTEKPDPRKDIIKKVDSIEQTGERILNRVPVDDIIRDILGDKHIHFDGYSFEGLVEYLKETYQSGEYPQWPTRYSACKNCEFRASEQELEDGKKSGFHECMSRQHGWMETDTVKPSIFEIWDFRSKVTEDLLLENRLLLAQLSMEDIDPKTLPDHISASERKWIQVQKAAGADESVYCLTDELRAQMNAWTYPLHFIDFETSAVALPFTAGRRPYEQIAFQFSHHQVSEDGSVAHKTEFLCTEPGIFPNFRFVRALREALGNDKGSIFMFASHENTILNAIISQLMESGEPDREELIAFLKTIAAPTKSNAVQWEGDRTMIDLRKLVLHYYYNPLTRGSNSIKALLPAILQSSIVLPERYSKSIGELGLTSHNFDPGHVWLKTGKGTVPDPYSSLPKLFEEWADLDLEETISGIDSIADGGMALTAYAKLQYVDMSGEERRELNDGLKKYCELDTLAMVMLYEHFRELIGDAGAHQ